MPRVIDADALTLLAVNDDNGIAVVRLEDIARQPTIDPEELRPEGEWVGEADGYADGELAYDVWYCSECNYCIDDGTDVPELLPNYCPNCGAKMEGTG